MNSTKTLFNRLVGAFILTTFTVSGLYGILVYNAMKYTEDDILTRRVLLEAEEFVREYRADKTTALLPYGIGLQSYLSSSPDLPVWLAQQPLGTRELHEEEIHVGVIALPDSEEKLYIVLSELDSSSLESELPDLFLLLVGLGLGITAIGLIIGVWLGKTITTPLNRLTQEIETNDGGINLNKKLPFYGFNRNDETGALSRAFTDLVMRLNGFLTREKEFTHHASHELRTPLAVIRNAVAVLRLPSVPAEKVDANLGRLEQAAREMEDLINTFLHLGREQQALDVEPVDLVTVLQRSLEKHAHLDDNNHLTIEKNLAADVVIATDAHLVQVLFDNIIRNMYMHGSSKATIDLDSNQLLVRNDISGFDMPINEEHGEPVVGSYGLDIIKKVSGRCGLKIYFGITDKIFTTSLYFNG